jgi:hypothetical protein
VAVGAGGNPLLKMAVRLAVKSCLQSIGGGHVESPVGNNHANSLGRAKHNSSGVRISGADRRLDHGRTRRWAGRSSRSSRRQTEARVNTDAEPATREGELERRLEAGVRVPPARVCKGRRSRAAKELWQENALEHPT